MCLYKNKTHLKTGTQIKIIQKMNSLNNSHQLIVMVAVAVVMEH